MPPNKLPTLNQVLAQKNSKQGLPTLHDVIGKGGGKLPSLQDVLSGKHQAVAAAPAKHHGLLHNLGADVVSAVAGLPEGLVQTVEHPIRTAKAVGHQYAQTYGPLTHGDVGTFLHNVHEHPLGPLLDAATIFTGGAGLAAKAGVLSSEAATLALRSPEALAAGAGHTVERLSSHNPAIRLRQVATHRLLNKLPYEARGIGEGARYGRASTRSARVAAQTLLRSKEAADYGKATRGLSNEELVAMHMIGNDLHPADYAASLRELQQQGGKVEPTMFKVLENPKVIELFENPSPKLLRAVDAAEALTKLDEQVRVGHGILDPAQAAQRVGKHRAAADDLLGGNLRPTPGRPFYVPDVAVNRRIANPELSRQGLGKGVPQAPGSARTNRGVRFQTGRLLLNADLLTPHFLETVKYALADDIHAHLMRGAAKITKDEINSGMKPAGWDYIPKEVVSKTSGLKRPATMHPMLRERGEALAATERMFPAAERLQDSFKVTDLSQAAQAADGSYLIAPRSMIKEATGEFTRSTGAVAQFINKPFKVWRALVLGFRVGFLTNNVIGNHLLYAIHALGPAGLRAYLNAVKRVHGDGMVKSLLRMKGMPEPLRQQFMREFFPEQIEGTFGRTQVEKIQSQKLRRLAHYSTGIAPATQAIAEGNLRRALVETYIRKSPEFKKIHNAMPRQTRDFEQAARQVIQGNKGAAYQARISEQVNNVLGDYLNLSKLEQDVLRQAFPFYAWYRAIIRITAHLAMDTPGRANILTKLGQVGAVETQKQLGALPDWLLNLVPLGGDKVLSTQGANPFNTIAQLGQGAAGVAAGQPGATGKAFAELGPHPFLLAAIQNLAGKNLYTGKAITGGAPGLPAQVVQTILESLPQTQLGKAAAGQGRTSKLYGKQSGLEALAQFLGVPVKTLDRARANSYASKP